MSERTLIVHTESIATVLQPGATGVQACLKASRKTATITLDPNVRPDIMGPVAQVREQVEDMVRLSDVVKVSDGDLDWIADTRDAMDLAKYWSKIGPAMIVVTLGNQGALALLAGDRGTEAPAPRSVQRALP